MWGAQWLVRPYSSLLISRITGRGAYFSKGPIVLLRETDLLAKNFLGEVFEIGVCEGFFKVGSCEVIVWKLLP
jgi:hypothetical protein